MKNYQTIIFDFGGVLGSDANSWTQYEDISILTALPLAKINEIFREHWESLKVGKSDLQDFFEEIQQSSNHTISVDKLRQLYHSKIFINEAVITLVKQLQPHYQLSVLANESREGMTAKVQKFGLDQYFTPIFNSAEIGLFKPDPKIFTAVLDKINTTPTETIFIDDQEKNVLTARQLGITSFLYQNFSTLSKDLKQVLGTSL